MTDAEAELDSIEVASDVGAGSSVAAPAEIAPAGSVPATSEAEAELDPLTEDEEGSEAEATIDVDSLEPVAAATVGSAVVDEAGAVLAASLDDVEAGADSSEAVEEDSVVDAAFKALMTKSDPRFCILALP